MIVVPPLDHGFFCWNALQTLEDNGTKKVIVENIKNLYFVNFTSGWCQGYVLGKPVGISISHLKKKLNVKEGDYFPLNVFRLNWDNPLLSGELPSLFELLKLTDVLLVDNTNDSINFHTNDSDNQYWFKYYKKFENEEELTKYFNKLVYVN